MEDARRLGLYPEIAESAEKGPCIFCHLSDKYIIHRNDVATLTVNKYPYIDGHLLVIPKRHILTYGEIAPAEAVGMHELVDLGIKTIKSTLETDDIWVLFRQGVNSGKTISHMHFHIFPFVRELYTRNEIGTTIPPADMAKRLRDAIER
jgi:diadenosine tetraphosphate (Ap4A) HIT family hydrolase